MSLHVVVGFKEKREDPQLIYLGKDGSEARAALDSAGESGVFEAHHFINPERSKRRIFAENAAKPVSTKKGK